MNLLYKVKSIVEREKKEHVHQWELFKQESLPMFTYHNTYKCQCGEEKTNYELFGKFYQSTKHIMSKTAEPFVVSCKASELSDIIYKM